MLITGLLETHTVFVTLNYFCSRLLKVVSSVLRQEFLQYDTRCYFTVHSSVVYRTEPTTKKWGKGKKLKSKNGRTQKYR